MTQKSFTILENKVTLYNRGGGSVWHARIKLKTGEWWRFSTKQTDFEEAKEVAEMERREERRAWVNLRKEIVDHAEYFNIPLKKALEENIINADVMYGNTGQVDLGYYCYKRGVPFSKYKVISKVLGQKVEKKYGDKIVNIEV